MTKVKAEKVYQIRVSGKREKIIEGTLDQIRDYFSYTLECGYSWNNKINTHPPTIRGLVSSIQNSYHETQRNCYQRTHVYLIKKDEVHTLPVEKLRDRNSEELAS